MIAIIAMVALAQALRGVRIDQGVRGRSQDEFARIVIAAEGIPHS
jgi:hypothetical protein